MFFPLDYGVCLCGVTAQGGSSVDLSFVYPCTAGVPRASTLINGVLFSLDFSQGGVVGILAMIIGVSLFF